MPLPLFVAIGCYTEHMPHVDGQGSGITIAAFDAQSGRLDIRSVVAGPRNPSYLALSPDGTRLYAVEELGAEAAPRTHSYAFDRATGALTLLGTAPSPGSAACHIITDRSGRFLYVSNFVSGDLLCYRLDADGAARNAPQVIARPGDGTARMHYAQEIGDDLVLVCDAGNDRLAAYRKTATGLDPDPVYEISTAPGSFPRHFALLPDGKQIVVAHELAETLGLAQISASSGKLVHVVPALPGDFAGKSSGAAVRLHPRAPVAYMSNRGHDSIFAARIKADGLEPIGQTPSSGQTPRDFALDPSGRWLVAAHQASNDLVVHQVDPETGVIGGKGQHLATGTPVSVLFLQPG
jgi:6-phosphogluconolactonase